MAAGDGRVVALLAEATALLDERAKQIADGERRALFLTVSAHRELLQATTSHIQMG